MRSTFLSDINTSQRIEICQRKDKYCIAIITSSYKNDWIIDIEFSKEKMLKIIELLNKKIK